MFILIAILTAMTNSPSAAELRSGQPIASYPTSTPVQSVALCISDKLGPVSLLNYGARDAITSRDRNSGVAIDIENGTARVWRVNGLDERTRRVVENCLAAPSDNAS